MILGNTGPGLWRCRQGKIGLALIAVCWPLNWLLPGVRTSYLFFPLWLGYILTVDALVWSRGRVSLTRRSGRAFAGLFIVSAPSWWLFELINHRTQNWEYLGIESFSDLEYALLCTVSFSTVMPAVFETAELVRTFRWTKRFTAGVRVPPRAGLLCCLFGTGWGLLALLCVWPNVWYPVVWLAAVLILEPLNHWLGRPHLLQFLERGNWRPLVSLSMGAFICGFFWELWNYYSWPKWVYHTPGIGYPYLFEMPLLGYGGYLFFAWELYDLRSLLWPRAPRLRL